MDPALLRWAGTWTHAWVVGQRASYGRTGARCSLLASGKAQNSNNMWPAVNKGASAAEAWQPHAPTGWQKGALG